MKRKTVRSFGAEFIRARKTEGFSPETVKHTKWRLERFLEYLDDHGITAVDEITSELVRAYQVDNYQRAGARGGTYSVPYMNSLLAAVKGFTEFLRNREYIVADPGQKVPYAKQPDRLPRSVLTTSEAKKILKAPDTGTVLGYRDRTILEVLYSSGIRKKELGNLTLADVDLEEGILRINRGKGAKDRVVPVGKVACRYLENYLKNIRPELSNGSDIGYLFLTARGTKFSKNVLWEMVKKYAKQVNIKKNVHPHTFRHSCATGMLRNKADLHTLQQLLGHASLSSTQVYVHMTITDLKEVHRKCHPREKEKV